MTTHTGTCAIGGCDDPVKARGYCNRHYLRDYRNGGPTAGAAFRWTDDDQRLWEQIDATGPCWEWTGSRTNGYGYTTHCGTRGRVHRIVWTLLVGPIPAGMQLDHLCRNRACCNPDHLEPVTQQENIRRGANGGHKPTCPNGHGYDIFIERRGGVERRCSACEKAKRTARTQRDAARRRAERSAA